MCALSQNHGKKGLYTCRVLDVKNLVGSIYLMRFSCPEIAHIVEPGQFVNIKVNSEYTPFLRKPFSICRRNKEQGWLEIVWKIVGKGTQILAEFKPGRMLNVIGPLGKGFSLPPKTEVAFLVGGGLGVAPLPFLCEELLKQQYRVEVFLGARSANEISLVDLFRESGVEVFLSTEDGSLGEKGLVTEILLTRLHSFRSLHQMHLFSCGPTGFLKAMMKLTDELSIEGQVSIETMMGCGFGICMGCPVRVRDGKSGGGLYKLTCIDGPVFNAREILLDE